MAKGKLETNIVMKTLTKLLAVLAIAALGQSAYGVTYLYQTADYVDQEYWLPTDEPAYAGRIGTSFSGTFDLTGDTASNAALDKFGFNPLLQRITDFEIMFSLTGALVEINFDSNSAPIPTSTGFDFDGLILGTAVTYQFNNGNLDGNLLLQLQNTGKLDWMVKVDEPQNIWGASLAVNAENKVPDSGATIGLLGACLLMLVQFKRRLK